ncbi:PP0621 family protein [Acidovorax sp. M2(2025)]|uniref:PP0621 family protein n=1 Tax=Acidovorax sp. M2(2025) TaxID=3411355 RepID=UPI003BF5C95F
MKYLVLLAVLAVAYGMWRNRRAKDAPVPPRHAARPPAAALPQAMLACAHCGVHVPQADALMAGNRPYCCAEHRARGPA